MPLGQNVLLWYSQAVQTNMESVTNVWGAYPDWEAVARFVYGRRMWRLPEMRARLLAHWNDPRHPYRERFASQRELIEEVLASDEPAEKLDEALRQRQSSLRCVAREIPPVFGSFFE
jgi:hypothetical protein